MSERISDAVSNVTYTASGTSFMFGTFTANEVVAIGGLLLASATFVINWIYKHKMYKLQVERLKKSNEETP